MNTQTPHCTEDSITVSDGIKLFYRHWAPAKPLAKRAIFLFHRGHEHGGRFQDLVSRLDAGGAHVFAWDARGHGRSPGRRGFAPSFARMVRDMHDFVEGVCQVHDLAIEDCLIVAHSVAAVVATTWVHDYAPDIRGLVLATPAFKVRLYVPLAVPALRLLNGIKGDASISSYVKSHMLTHDPLMAKDYDEDPLISKAISNRILIQMRDAADRVVRDAGAIHVPLLMLSAGSDWVVDRRVQERFFDTLGSQDKTRRTFPGMYHAILHEKDRQPVIDCIADFATRLFDDGPPREDLRGGDPGTRSRYRQISAPLPLLHYKRLTCGLTRAVMKTIGRLSTGIRIGWKYGFDSGQSLDHVYRHRAGGFTMLGKVIDHNYINSLGWQGIRTRRQHLQQALRGSIDDALEHQDSVHVVDVASGPGRYLLDTISDYDARKVSAECRDRDPVGVAQGQQLAQDLGVHGVRFRIGDAFDPIDIAAGSRPDIVIVSGLYELFPDNRAILRSLRAIAATLPAHGRLIITNQPWHPQLGFIARCLDNRDGEPWVMRCRSQSEMNQLLREAGFAAEGYDIDEHGIFSVTVAGKAAA